MPETPPSVTPAIAAAQRRAAGVVWRGNESAAKREDRRQMRTNPLYGLTLETLRQWLDRATLYGDFPRLMMLYYYMERRFGELGAILDRREGALKKLRWKIVAKDDSPAAAIQQAELDALYGGIENLDEALAHFHLADFRGFSVAQILTDATHWPVRIDCIPHWFIRRDGMHGAWRYCPGQSTEGEELRGNAFVIRTVDRPVNEVAALRWVPANFTFADFNSFMEGAADPATYIVKPPPGIMSAEGESAFDDMADESFLTKKGIFPNGTSIVTPPGDNRSADIFQRYFETATMPVILRGTGGMLTTIAKSGGLGNGAADVQDDAFDDIAENTRTEIETLFEKAISEPWLAARFPGQPTLARFELGREAKKNLAALSVIVRNLTSAGFRPRIEWVSREFGMEMEDKNPAAEAAAAAAAASVSAAVKARKEAEAEKPDGPAVQNRAAQPPNEPMPAGLTEAIDAAAEALQDSFQPIAEKLAALLDALDGAEELTPEITAMLQDALDEMDAADAAGAPPELADAMEAIHAAAYLEGLTEAANNDS